MNHSIKVLDFNGTILFYQMCRSAVEQDDLFFAMADKFPDSIVLAKHYDTTILALYGQNRSR